MIEDRSDHVVSKEPIIPFWSGIHRFLINQSIDKFRYIKIQPKTMDVSTRLWGINPTNSVVIPQRLALRSIVFG